MLLRSLGLGLGGTLVTGDLTVQNLSPTSSLAVNLFGGNKSGGAFLTVGNGGSTATSVNDAKLIIDSAISGNGSGPNDYVGNSTINFRRNSSGIWHIGLDGGQVGVSPYVPGTMTAWTDFNFTRAGISHFSLSINGDLAATSALRLLGGIAVGYGNVNAGASSFRGNYDFQVQATGGSVGLTITQSALAFAWVGGIVNLNLSSNFAVNICTGTSNGLVTIGGVNSTGLTVRANGLMQFQATGGGPLLVIDGALSRLGFFNVGPILQPVLATGVAHTTDDVITFLQNYGLCRQV